MKRGASPTIADRLAAAIGVDPDSLDSGRLQWIVEGRCRLLGFKDPAHYVAHLQTSDEELNALVEEVVIQETRFFRDPAVFESIRAALPALAESFPGPLRILSAPCGTGQEAYSLAATCQQAGIPLSRFLIDAFDISETALATARRAAYPEQSLRHLSLEQQRSCATLHHNHWKIHEALRQRIHFERRNLAEPGALTSGEPKYHLILCRNLFIYLRPQARAALAQSLAAALFLGGRLVVGTADRVEELKDFAPVRPASSFAFTHRAPAVAAPESPRATVAPRPLPARGKRKPLPEPAQTPATAPELLKNAIEYQQIGNLSKAERRCRQALYLAPEYIPALELLLTLWHQQPNSRLRHALKARLVRTRLAAQIPSTFLERMTDDAMETKEVL